MEKTFVSYLRVSTGRQAASGLGLEAQRGAVRQYAQQNGGAIIEEFVEVETGRRCDRPALVQSIARCKATGATLLIAKLDRLARNVAFIANLMETGVEFVAADTPFANRLMLHILAAFAEHEREQISARTRAALAAAKVRGVELGRNGRRLALRNRAEACNFAIGIAPQLLMPGSSAEIARLLNASGIRARGGGAWTSTQVCRARRRLSADVLKCDTADCGTVADFTAMATG